MIWDRLFGTYTAETATPVYGLTKPFTATNPLTIVAGGYPELVRDMRAADGARARVAMCLGRP